MQGRIGGTRQGSQGYVWQLAAAGERLQRHRSGGGSRRRYTEPNRLFMEHRAAVNDLVVSLREHHHTGRIELLNIEAEPECWRTFMGSHGQQLTLKPDLYAVIAQEDFEDHWFIEVDLATEHLPQIVAKAKTYGAHAASAQEQRKLGIYPAVLWLTTNAARAEAMRAALRTDPKLPNGMFTVTTLSSADDVFFNQAPP
jgi:hypothetical protein